MTPKNSLFGLIRTLSLVSIVWLLLFSVSEAPAQEADSPDDPWAGVEEMVVSGSTAGGILADVAQSNSVTAFSSQDLEAIGAADISDLANFTPNLEIVTAGSTSPTFFIRGIGLNDFNANAAGAVAVYTDDVPLNSPALQLGSLFDIESANVLRGPQGTGSFRNASAGAIKVYSKKPTGDLGAAFKMEFGNYDSRDFEGSLQFPITDETLWARFSFRVTEREGTLENRCAGAAPLDQRTRRPLGTPDRGPWQQCGESVDIGRISRVDPNQPKWINSRDNWAARGVFLFQPDLGSKIDMDMDWLITVRGSRRDEPSFLGQAVGTQGTQTFFDPNTGVPTRPPVRGLYGGSDIQGYTSEDVSIMRSTRLAKERAFCEPSCTQTERRLAGQRTNRWLTRQVARELDLNPFRGAYSHTGGTTNDTYGVSVKGSFEFGDSLELTSVTGWDGWERVVDIDLDFTPNTAFEINTADEGSQVFQEFRLNGQSFDGLDEIFGGPLEWEVGAFVLYEELDVDVAIDFGAASALVGAPTGRVYTQDLTSIAGWFNFSWDFWDAFTLDGGVRYNWEQRKIDYELTLSGPSILQKEKFTGTEPTGTIRLTWRPTEQSSLYAKYTHGWKSGTFNATGSASLGVTNARPEKIDAVEIGMRASYFDDRLNMSLSLFHYTYQDYQLFTSLSAFQSPPQFVIINASDVELFGSEVEATYLPWDGGLVDVKFAWLEGEFLDFVQQELVNSSIGNTPLTFLKEIRRSGNTLLNAPRYSITLSLQQAIPLGRFGSLVARWDGTWKAKTYFDASEGRGVPNGDEVEFMPRFAIGQSPYWIHNVRLSYITPDESIEVAGWVRNMLNEEFAVFSADLSTFQRTTLHFIGDPRTFGVTASVKF